MNILSNIRIVFLAVIGLLAGIPAMALETFTLPRDLAIKHDATIVVKVTHTDLTETTAATAQTIAIYNVANKIAVSCTKAVLKTDFQDTTDSGNNTTAIEVGDGGDTDRLLTSTELNVNGSEVDQKVGVALTYAYTSSDTVDVKFLAPTTGKNLAALNAGEVWIYLKIHDDR